LYERFFSGDPWRLSFFQGRCEVRGQVGGEIEPGVTAKSNKSDKIIGIEILKRISHGFTPALALFLVAQPSWLRPQAKTNSATTGTTTEA